MCKYCGQVVSKELLANRETIRRTNISKGLANSKEKIGRPRVSSYAKIYELRAEGYSLKRIAERLNCSTGAVEYALKLKQPPAGKE